MKPQLRALALALASLVIATTASASAQLACQTPSGLAEQRPETVPAGEIVQVPVVGYKLALSWSAEFCRAQATGAKPSRAMRSSVRTAAGNGNPVSDQTRCAGNFGFILHGLWPDGADAVHPRYCRPVGAVPLPVLRRAYCLTPSARLLQHEWQAHGSCGWADPARFFAQVAALRSQVRLPDMDALIRQPRLVAGDLRAAFGRANPGRDTRAMFIGMTAGGWLDEVRFCFDTGYRTIACDRAGAPDRVPLRIRPRNPAGAAMGTGARG